jgi:hypothetical protein
MGQIIDTGQQVYSLNEALTALVDPKATAKVQAFTGDLRQIQKGVSRIWNTGEPIGTITATKPVYIGGSKWFEVNVIITKRDNTGLFGGGNGQYADFSTVGWFSEKAITNDKVTAIQEADKLPAKTTIKATTASPEVTPVKKASNSIIYIGAGLGVAVIILSIFAFKKKK